MGAVLGKGGSYTTGYRYYFSILMGVCRGPVDSIFLMKADNLTFWDGSPIGRITTADRYDPASPYGIIPFDAVPVAYSDGEITSNRPVPIAAPQLFGGDKGEGGLQGIAWVYMGGKAQLLNAPTDYIQTVMLGLRLSSLRGVVTVFYDGEVAANNPYPKPWTFRVRRTVSGWDRAPWYPTKAMIQLTDPALPVYTKSYALFGGGVLSTQIYDPVSGTYSTVTSSYSGSSISTFTAGGGVIDSVAVPLAYNDIHAMNPAHIIYECCTNRDWGRGLDPLFLNEPSFVDAANTLYDEKFGLCLKWSRTEDVDVFVQNVLDHIGAVLYTDKITGLLCLRLIRGGYTGLPLSTFDYTTGLLEVTSVETAANDAIVNEVIVTYYSPVLDAQKEARQQNLASINRYGCVFSVTKDYSGIPTSILALRVAARDLRAGGSGYKRVEFKVDRRGYAIVPGDVLILNAPDRAISNLIVRVATVDDTVITDGSIAIVAAQDVFGLPETPTTDPALSTFLEPDLTPKPITTQYIDEATYRDIYRALGAGGIATYTTPSNLDASFAILTAAKPSSSSLNYDVAASVFDLGTSSFPPAVVTGTARFADVSKLTTAIGTTDTTFLVKGSLLPTSVAPGAGLTITDVYADGGPNPFTQEFVRLDAISSDPTSGYVRVTVARGAVDTPALPHAPGSLIWAYDETGVGDMNEYHYGDGIQLHGLTRTSRGVLDLSLSNQATIGAHGRLARPYIGANFRVNGYPRDLTPAIAGDLNFTWNTRNRLTQQDQLVGELESGIAPETGQTNSIVVTGTGGAFYGLEYPAGPGAPGSSATVTSAQLTAAGITPGPISIAFSTIRADPPSPLPFAGFTPSWSTDNVTFNWLGASAPAPAGAGGWDTSFGSGFGGGTMLSYSSGFGTSFGGTGP